MKNVEYYERLPEALDQNIIEAELQELVNDENIISNENLVKAIYELADRQVINYNAIDSVLKSEITRIAIELWDRNSYENTTDLLSITYRLGLQELYVYFKQNVQLVSNVEILKELEGVFLEFGESVEDVSFHRI